MPYSVKNQLTVPEVLITWHKKSDLTEEHAAMVKESFDGDDVLRYYCAVENLDADGRTLDVHFHICVTFFKPVQLGPLAKRLKDAWGISYKGMRGGYKGELRVDPLDDFERVAGGYASKRTSELFEGPSKNVSILDLKRGNEEWLATRRTKKPIQLYRASVLHEAYKYRRDKKLTTTDLWEVLALMVNLGTYDLTGCCGRNRIPTQYEVMFEKRCKGEDWTAATLISQHRELY